MIVVWWVEGLLQGGVSRLKIRWTRDRSERIWVWGLAPEKDFLTNLDEFEY